MGETLGEKLRREAKASGAEWDARLKKLGLSPLADSPINTIRVDTTSDTIRASQSSNKLIYKLALFAAVFAILSGMAGAVFNKIFEWYAWLVWIGLGAVFIVTLVLGWVFEEHESTLTDFKKAIYIVLIACAFFAMIWFMLSSWTAIIASIQNAGAQRTHAW